MRKTLVAFSVVGVCVSPAFAQTQTQTPAGQQKSIADCTANFQSADKNGDGRLDKAEMSDASNVVPTALASQDSVTQQEFITACNAGRPKGG
jgi:Ca2+-binding EF-hand superfamily protein